MKWARTLSSCAIIVVVILSVYFGAVAAAPKPNAVGPSLVLYQLGSQGRIVASTSNVFEAGAEIWIGFPGGASSPYTLNVTSNSGSVWGTQNTTLPVGGLIPLSLSPSLFPPESPYALLLRDTVEYSPGFSSVQTSTASFSVVPALANMLVSAHSFLNSTVRASINLQDQNSNSLTGVRVGLFMLEGNSSLEVATEKTNAFGQASFSVGEALGGGSYQFQLRVLDRNAVYTNPVQLTPITVSYIPTQLAAWTPAIGTVQSRLVRSDSMATVDGRLLTLEEKLVDGNWAVISHAYTDSTGQVLFQSNTSKTLRVSFNGDDFYNSSRSPVSNSSSAPKIPASTLGLGSSVSSGPNAGSTGYQSDTMGIPLCLNCPCSPVPASPLIVAGSVSPNCGGGGGGGGSGNPTSMTLYMFYNAYPTIPLSIKAQVVSSGQGVGGLNVSFSVVNTEYIGSATTNSTGYASVIWTPNFNAVNGSVYVMASFAGTSTYQSSSALHSLGVSQTPTTIEMLQPQQIAYAWDVGSNIAIPVVTLVLAPSGNGSPKNVYVPAYTRASSTPPSITNYGWAGLNQSSVTITLNGTYTMTQLINWTRNMYMPACPNPNFNTNPPCGTHTPLTGDLSFTASLAPPSNLYASSSTTLNVPYQKVNDTIISANHPAVNESFVPPNHLYVNVTSDYPFLTVKLQGVPVALANFNYNFESSIGGPISSNTTILGYTYYTLPSAAQWARVCSNSSCKSPSQGALVAILNTSGQTCYSAFTDWFGIVNVALQSSGGNCTPPYATAEIYTGGSAITLSELFTPETSNLNLYTNFQGYAFAPYTPLKTGHYLVVPMTWPSNDAFTILYPNQTYSATFYISSPEALLNVEKHPLQAQVSFTPALPTTNDKTNATIQLQDMGIGQGMANTAFNYTLVRTNGNPTGVVMSGSLVTNSSGIARLPIGWVFAGNYTLTISRTATPSLSGLSTNFNFTTFQAKPTLIIKPGWLNAVATKSYTFTTSLVNNATQTMITVSGLNENVYVNNGLLGAYLTNQAGNATFSWTPQAAGQYQIRVVFPAQDYYYNSSILIMVSVQRANVVLAVSSSPPTPLVNNQVTWNVTAEDMMDNRTVSSLPVSLLINGSNTTRVLTRSSGFALINYTFTSKGSYNITFVSATTSTYNSATSYNPLNVYLNTTLTIQAGTIIVDQQNSITVTLKDQNGNALASRAVQVSVNGASYANLTTGNNGQASLTWTPNKTGNYTIGASFTATGSADTGYESSSTSVAVIVKPQTIINTQTTGSGTQSVTFNTAQRSTSASPNQFSFSIQFSLGSMSITVNLNGKTGKTTASSWNEFGWACVARVFGSCVLSVPYWKLHTHVGVSGLFDLAMSSYVPVGPASGSNQVAPNISLSDESSAEFGLVDSALPPAFGVGTLIAAGGPIDPAALELGAVAVATGIGATVIAALVTLSAPSAKTFLGGFLLPIIGGALCATTGVCALPELPPLPLVEYGVLGVLAWATYFSIGVVIPFGVGGALASLIVLTFLALAGIAYTLL